MAAERERLRIENEKRMLLEAEARFWRELRQKCGDLIYILGVPALLLFWILMISLFQK